MATSFLSSSGMGTATVAGGPYNASSGLQGEELEHAAAIVDQSVHIDRAYNDLSDLLQVPKHNCPTSSGLLDMDYPNQANISIGLPAVNELGGVKKIPLPAELVEQFEHMQLECMMGLFPEISRAWLSIDSRIFVWNYEDGSDLALFDGLSEIIGAVGLVKPKPGIFQPHINALLCLATPVDIVLLGVSFNKPYQSRGEASKDFSEMHLLPEPLFSIPTDNVHITCIKGADNGRVFMAGKDGCLYELIYQAEDGWFSRKCRKVNHSTSKLSYLVPSFLNFSFADDDPLVDLSIDNSRHILYCRSSKGTIHVYDVGADGHGMSRVAAISNHTTVENAALVTKSIDKSNFSPIIHVAAIESSESTNIHLVAITHTGIRLYFTTHNFHNPSGRPSMLNLVHVRLPPGFSANDSLRYQIKNVHTAYYSKGSLVLSAGETEDNDTLWTISGDAFPFTRHLMETKETTHIDGRTWAMSEIPSHRPVGNMEHGLPGRPQPPLVVTQHLVPDRRFVILNSQGSYLVSKLRPVDQLEQLLLQSGDVEPAQPFFALHKEQACATCLILATRHSGGPIAELATRAFFKYGGDPEYNYNAQPANIGPTLGASHSFMASPGGGMGGGPMMSTPYPGQETNPAFSTFSSPPPVAPSGGEVMYSYRHNGLCLYLARLLRPMWEAALVDETHVQQGPHGQQTTYFSCHWSGEEIGFVLSRLLSLKEFLEKNSQFTSPLAAESYSAAQRGGGQRGDLGMDDQTRRKYQAIADRQETVSLSHLQQLVSRICETLALLNILTDHQFHVIAAALTKDDQNSLRHMNLRNFVTVGKGLCNSLIVCLINLYMDDNAATDAISQSMREVCPNLYSAEDALCSKGSEKLQLAKSGNPAEREMHLQEALRVFKEIAVHLNLPQVCMQFSQVRYYVGIVDLSLTAAAKRDPQELALHYYKNGEHNEDSAGRHAYAERKDCYNCITETLEYLLSVSSSHPQAPKVPRLPGPPPPADPNALSNTDAANHAEEMLSLSLRSDDELLHVALYEWLLHKGLWERLLDINSPYLEPYLQHTTRLRPTDNKLLDLLWKYYKKHKNFTAAAKILTKLATTHSTAVSLSERVEYLSRATMCAKSVVGGGGELLHELEEKMEVARLQQQIYDTLSNRLPASSFPAGEQPSRADVCSRLNSDLLDITTLYGEYADRYDLCECKLAIIHCASHYDPTLVESLWFSIIQQELQLNEKREKTTRMKILHDKLVSLGQVYAASSEKYFPLAYLVKFLEQISCEYDFDRQNVRFVFSIMQEIGITIPRLHDIYDRLYKSKDSCWKNLHRPFHILYVIHQLLDTFASNPAVVPHYERRAFNTHCQDAVAHYLVELHTESTTNPDVQTLNRKYKQLQADLERGRHVH